MNNHDKRRLKRQRNKEKRAKNKKLEAKGGAQQRGPRTETITDDSGSIQFADYVRARVLDRHDAFLRKVRTNFVFGGALITLPPFDVTPVVTDGGVGSLVMAGATRIIATVDYSKKGPEQEFLGRPAKETWLGVLSTEVTYVLNTAEVFLVLTKGSKEKIEIGKLMGIGLEVKDFIHSHFQAEGFARARELQLERFSKHGELTGLVIPVSEYDLPSDVRRASE